MFYRNYQASLNSVLRNMNKLFEIVGCPCTTRYTDHAIPALQGMYLWDEMGRRGLSKNGSIHFAHIFVANDL